MYDKPIKESKVIFIEIRMLVIFRGEGKEVVMGRGALRESEIADRVLSTDMVGRGYSGISLI